MEDKMNHIHKCKGGNLYAFDINGYPCKLCGSVPSNCILISDGNIMGYLPIAHKEIIITDKKENEITWEYPKEDDIISEVIVISDFEKSEREADLLEHKLKVYILMGYVIVGRSFDRRTKVYAATLNPEICEKLLRDHIHDYRTREQEYTNNYDNHEIGNCFWWVEEELTN